MKVYIHNRKVGDTYEKAMSVYNNRGKLLYSDYGRILENDMQKFDKTLYAIEWGLKQFRKIAQNGVVSETEPVTLFICSKTIYELLRQEKSPVNYVGVFSNIEMELSLMVNEVDIVYSKSTKALYKSTEDKAQSMKDFMKEFGDLED
jgi:hypothetical protein